jgi:hypothetical protein
MTQAPQSVLFCNTKEHSKGGERIPDAKISELIIVTCISNSYKNI